MVRTVAQLARNVRSSLFYCVQRPEFPKSFLGSVSISLPVDGEGSIPLVILSAAFISMALTSQAVLELQRFGAEDLARPLIAVGLLRELGPLTVSIPP
jgi:ABC-type transporter Mla maintaining outer membrane lipid asymmetry permease subunit MlaE